MGPLALGLVAALALAVGPHPLHTSYAEVSVDTRARRVEVRLRIFADDLATATGGMAPPADSAVFAYIRGAFTVASPRGALPLRPVGLRRSGDLVWAELTAEVAAAELAGLTVHDRVLFERYGDQVNIVRATRDGRTASILFTPGDRPKGLP
jgi:hypothetical protein